VLVIAPSATVAYGDAIPAMTPTYSNLAPGQTAPDTPPTCTTTATSASPPGVYPTTCSGAAHPNQAFVYVAGSITILPASVTVTASSAAIEVGDAVPAITASYAGLKNGDTAPAVLAACSTSATSASPAGSYPTSCSGASDPNYAFTYVDGSITIANGLVTVTASSSITTYGDPVPPVTATYAGFELGETAPATLPTCTTAAGPTSPAGSYATSCSGAADPNYTFTYVGGTAAIAPASATVTASSGSFATGAPVPPVTPTYTGLVNGDTAPATAPTCTSTATSSSPPGAYATSCSGAADPNYTFGYVGGTHTVTASAPVTVTASSATITYGDPIPAITASYAGFTGGQTTPTGPPTCSTTATAASLPGTYPTTCTGATDPNFSFTYVAGTLTIQKAQVIVTASSGSMTYGSTPPSITAGYAGFVDGEPAPATPATCSSTATSASDVGSYPSSCSGAADPKYDFTYVNGSVTVNAASALVTASSPTMTYGGTVATVTPAYSGLVNGDTAPATPPTCSTTATSSSPVGTYASSCAGAADPNYVFSYAGGTVTVGKAAATVTAGSPSMTYGAAVPTITPGYSGLVNGDTAPATAPTCSTTATASSPVGTYPSSCSGAADPNYTFSYAGGTVTVAPASVTVTASDATMTQGDTPPAITPSYAGFLLGQTAPATAPTCSTTATAFSPVGTYPSSCSGAADPNYTFTYVNGTVTVTAPPPTGYAAYSSDPSHATTVAAGSNGAAVGAATLYVASGTGAGFETYTNLTIQTSANGPQPAFCKSIGATSMGTCSSVGSGTVVTGAVVTDSSITSFDVYTIIPGGKTAVEPSSVTVLADVPSAVRAMPTHVQADANLGLVKFVRSSSASGQFSLTFGYCDTGTATYSSGSPACHTGTINYAPTTIQTMGDQVAVSIVTTNIYQKVGVAVKAPASVPQGSTFTAVVSAGAASLPKLQATILGDVTVNSGSNILAVVPVPNGMTFQSASLMGGDALTSGKAVVTYCPTKTSPGCTAQTAAQYSNTTAPYVQVSMPGVVIPGGGTATMPSAVVTMVASGAPGTVSNTHLTQFSLTTSTSLGSAVFHGYPSDPAEPNVNPPTWPPVALATTVIT
jgi:hypothetical protein